MIDDSQLVPTRPKVRVVVVDDSTAMRTLLSEILSADPDIEVVGAAPDAFAARNQIKVLNPDVITLDVEMPKMDGLQFLKNIMRLRPMPVIMVSSLTAKGTDITLKALAMGAVDVVCKPGSGAEFAEFAEEVTNKVKMAKDARITRLITNSDRAPERQVAPEQAALKEWLSENRQFSDSIIAIGASTGGVEAVSEVLTRLPADIPAIMIVQHIPKTFSSPFATRMNSFCAVNVCEAKDGQEILRGHVYIAPGDQHLTVVRRGTHFLCRLNQNERVNHHRPSVDVLFNSVAKRVGSRAIGVILTGMGRDGADGLKAMKQAGAATLAQDEESSVVWGMPGAAVKEGAVDEVHPLDDIAKRIVKLGESLTIKN